MVVDSTKAQLTGFILLVVSIVIFFMVLTFVQVPQQIPVQSDSFADVKPLISSCLHKGLSQTLILTALQGGYVTLPPTVIQTPYGTAGIFANGSLRLAPPIDSLRREIELATASFFTTCISNLSSTQLLGATIQYLQEPSIDVTLTDRESTAILTTPVKIQRGTTTDITSTYSITLPIRFLTLYTYAEQSSTRNNILHGLDLSYLDSLDVQAEATPLSPQVLLLYLTDFQSLIDGKPFIFATAFAQPDSPTPTWEIPQTVRAPSRHRILTDATGWKLISNHHAILVTENTATIKGQIPGTYQVTLRALSPTFEEYHRTIEVIIS